MQSSTFKEQVYEHLLDRLLNRTLKPGDFLDRKQVAKDLQVSLIPVSDAVQRLTSEGFLATHRRRGTFVETPSVEDVRGQLLLREALECQAARLYCGVAVKSAKRRLLPLANAADKAADAGQALCYEDYALHQALVELTECDALVDCFHQVIRLAMFYEANRIAPLQPVTYDRHSRLLTDLGKATPEEADARIRRHIRMGKEALFGLPEQNNGRTAPTSAATSTKAKNR